MNEYWIVTENRTGKIIAHCGDINDAIMMVNCGLNHSNDIYLIYNHKLNTHEKVPLRSDTRCFSCHR